MWNKVKRVFKKKKQRDQVITYEGGSIGLKDFGYPMLDEEIPHNMKIHAKFVSTGTMTGGKQMSTWEINGVMITAEDLITAQRKYLRQRSL